MKRALTFAVTTLIATFALTPAAFAQTSTSPARATERALFRLPDGVVESSKVVGAKIKSVDGKDLGEIDYLLFDSKTGKITHAVVGLGGVLGVGETKVVVPWSAVNLKHDARDKMMVTMDQSLLERAPRYDRRDAAAERTTPAASPRTDEKRTGAPR